MKVVTSEQMRELDRRTISDCGISAETLMDRAGVEVAEVVHYLAGIAGYDSPPVHLIAGRGNNGGDAFAAARHLKEDGFDVEVWLAGEVDGMTGDALKHLNRMKSAGVSLRELPTKRDWESAVEANDCNGGGILVDGVLGIGISGPARGPAAGAISYINAFSNRNLVVSIDVPSGMNADTGAAEGDVVTADITITMGLPKTGLIEPVAINHVGALEVADIGIPPRLYGHIESDRELITRRDLRAFIARRPRDSHKGMFGHVLLIGGARGYSGAIALAARAATRSGVGLVTVLTPVCVADVVAGIVPEAMVNGCAQETKTGSLSSDCLSLWNRDINDFDAVMIGPGMTADEHTQLLVKRVLASCRKPLVMDADAINACAGRIELIARARGPVILTPHPGEMGRLVERDTAEIQADRFKWAGEVAARTNAVVVLKGAGTIVALKGAPLNVCPTGNPGMATGGMGDVLSGLIGGIAARPDIKPFDAARMGVYLHGRAGDNVAWRTSQAGMTAGDVIEELPMVFRELAVR
jgi:NAD(P)H-hydrate epimerase